ncbi:MAG: hypothetical protein R3A51_03295 [Nannocystaceae bacterium]|nr:hypothetical protein [Myxococcales bacterium]
MAQGTDVTQPASLWIRAPLWDLALLGFCWVPLYLWFVFGLGLDGSWTGAGGTGTREALSLAAVVALAITYVHRHYTFLLVYGDRDTFHRRARAFTLAPVLVFAALIALRGAHAWLDRPISLGFASVRPWMLALGVTGVWNVWHTMMQRYGILRIYAGKAGRGLELRAHARRDLALLWTLVGLVACLALLFRQSTFAGSGNARRVLAALSSVSSGPGSWALLAGALAVTAAVGFRWARHEFAAPLPWRLRLPRLLFLGSTACLLLVFIVHGPIVGYLCFGVAHALEYVAFFHHFGQRKFAQRPDDRGLVARLLRRPMLYAPLVIGLLLAVFVALVDYRKTHVYVIYYIGTSMLHFLFDGWIWKVRKPEVRAPLGVA